MLTKTLTRLLAVAALAVLAAWSPAVGGADDYPPLAFGTPSKAGDDGTDKTNFLMKKPQFALAYDNSRGAPRWVSWRLRKDEFGGVPRKPFFPDPTLPEGFLRVKPMDYHFDKTG